MVFLAIGRCTYQFTHANESSIRSANQTLAAATGETGSYKPSQVLTSSMICLPVLAADCTNSDTTERTRSARSDSCHTAQHGITSE